MTWLDRISLFSTLDGVALGLLVVTWLLIGWRIEHASARSPSTSQIMAGYRREWMRQMITRQPRIFDAQVVASLRQGTAFFASTSVIAIGGTLAVIGNAERVTDIANELTLMDTPAIVWEAKLVVLVLFLTNAFLKFVWANRLFGYAAVVMAAVPNDPSDPICEPRAMQAAEVNITAARSFNRGLRSVYFGLTCAAWLAGPVPLIAATIFTLGVIWRREFASQSRTTCWAHRRDKTTGTLPSYKAVMKHLVLALLIAATPARAEEPLIENATAIRTAPETYRFDVTIRHPDTGWDHYADGWRVLDMDGNELGMRVLFHPHVDEQPFTRSLDGVKIPAGTPQVQVQARDLPAGWNAGTTIVDLR